MMMMPLLAKARVGLTHQPCTVVLHTAWTNAASTCAAASRRCDHFGVARCEWSIAATGRDHRMHTHARTDFERERKRPSSAVYSARMALQDDFLRFKKACLDGDCDAIRALVAKGVSLQDEKDEVRRALCHTEVRGSLGNAAAVLVATSRKTEPSLHGACSRPRPRSSKLFWSSDSTSMQPTRYANARACEAPMLARVALTCAKRCSLETRLCCVLVPIDPKRLGSSCWSSVAHRSISPPNATSRA